MSGKTSFGVWLRQRRKILDLSLDKLAEGVGCAAVTLYKIEAGERRPSRQIAELLAKNLNIPAEDRSVFIRFARGDEVQLHWGMPPNNLMSPPSPLIGREQDIMMVRNRLTHGNSQLVTLVGSPGVGKTRLSLAVAYALLNEFPDGVFFVPLAPISDAELVPRVIIQTLGILEVGPQPLMERLKTFLRDKQMLLVLDNFEHVLPAAPQIAEFLAVSPFVKILITSRAPLRIRRERQFPVPALALPDMQHLAGVEALSTFTAIELFIERAQAVKPDFSLTPENGLSVAGICNRLDGLPLAIELISARIKLFPPAALLERLHGKLMLQSDGLRDLEPRHRTLNAAIGWSYDLLTERERVLFRRLGVFWGGWTIEAAETVCQTDNIVDGIASLLDKSLVQRKARSGEVSQFTMLETIRAFALECLEESGESQDIRRVYARYFLKVAETPAVEQSVWLDRIEQNYDNVRGVLTWCFSSELATGLRLARAISIYWFVRGPLTEGRFWIEKYLKARHLESGTSVDIVRDLLSGAANLAHFQDDMPAMRGYGEALLSHGEARRDESSVVLGCFYSGLDALTKRDFGRAETVLEKGLALTRQSSNPSLAGSILLMLGNLAYFQKNYDRADTYYSEGLTLSRQSGNRIAEHMLLLCIGSVREEQGYYQEARNLYQQSLSICRDLGDKLELSNALEYLGGLGSRVSAKCHHAAQLMGAAEGIRESISAPVPPLEQSHHDDIVARLHVNLDETSFKSAWVAGRLMTLEQAIEQALLD